MHAHVAFVRQIQYNHTTTMSTATNGSTEKHLVLVNALQKKGATHDELMELYDSCASKDYEQVRVSVNSLSSVGSMLDRCLYEIAAAVTVTCASVMSGMLSLTFELKPLQDRERQEEVISFDVRVIIIIIKAFI